MSNKTRCLVMALAVMLATGCSSNQTLHDTWKGTKSLWYTYVSQPAVIDYEESGDMSQYEMALAARMVGIDAQLGQLERVMVNADKAPTPEWLQSFFARFPWTGGVAGVRADGQLLGHEPASSLKVLDFLPLLAEDSKQGMRDLRGYVENTPLGPEVILAVPLYDASTFLGVVLAHFDMRSLLRYASEPEELVIFSPEAVLWPGRFDVAATPLAEVNWEEALKKGSSGQVSNEHGSFYWLTRYLGNQPLVFAVPVAGTFPAGNGAVGPVGLMRDRPKPPTPMEKTLATESEEDVAREAVSPSPFGPKGEGTPATPEPDGSAPEAEAVPDSAPEVETVPDSAPEAEAERAPEEDNAPAPLLQRPSPFGPR